MFFRACSQLIILAPEAHRAGRTVLQRPQVSRTSDAAPPLQKSLFFGAVFIEAETFGQKAEQIVSDGAPACQECPVGTLEQLYRVFLRYLENTPDKHENRRRRSCRLASRTSQLGSEWRALLDIGWSGASISNIIDIAVGVGPIELF